MPGEPKAAEDAAPATTLTRAAVAERIAQRLAGRLSDAALAAWAFDRFYEVELGAASLETGAEDVLEDALDALMFGDDPAFRLSEEELRALAARLTTTGYAT
ncbi:MAG TPA: hypothetical protein VNL77_15790 [Roseiflexaceae bacterium]|nr:hypothetical protein [Roseiflexaceae bacterium]